MASNLNGARQSLAQLAEHLTTCKAPISLGEQRDLAIKEKVASLMQEFQRASTLNKQSRMVGIAQRPLYRWFTRRSPSPQAAALSAAVDGACERIEINHVNLNAKEMVRALEKALLRGVNVDIVLPKGACDNFYARLKKTNADTYARLQNFVETRHPVGQLRMRWHRYQGQSTAAANHTKVMFVDRALVVFGSANLDTQSWKYAGEFGIASHDPAIVTALRNAAFADAFESGVEFKLEATKKKSP